jgi:hypothetical protein
MTSFREELASTETEVMCQRRLLRLACLYLRLINDRRHQSNILSGDYLSNFRACWSLPPSPYYLPGQLIQVPYLSILSLLNMKLTLPVTANNHWYMIAKEYIATVCHCVTEQAYWPRPSCVILEQIIRSVWTPHPILRLPTG